MNQKLFMHVDETTSKVMESIQRELSTAIENKLVDQGQRVMRIHETLETIGDEIANHSGDLEYLRKAFKELKESVDVVNNQMQTIQNDQKRIASITEIVQEKSSNFQAAIDYSNLETIKAIEKVLHQQEYIWEKGTSSQIEQISSISSTVNHANGIIIGQMKSQETEIKEITNNVAISKSFNEGILEMLNSIKKDGSIMSESIQLTTKQLYDIVACIDELKSEVSYLKEPFFKRWFYKKKRGNI